MENINSNRANFLLIQYANNRESIKHIQGNGVTFSVLNILNNPEEYYSELKPISSISDYQLSEIIDFSQITIGNHELDMYKDLSELRKYICEKGIWTDRMLDYIRSEGFACRYNGLSVEEQISYGWVKLKTEYLWQRK